MNLPSARPNETVKQEFTVANSYTAAQVILALLIPFVFIGLYIGAVQMGVLSGFPEDFQNVARNVFIFVGAVLGLYMVLSAIYLRLARHYFVTNERIIQVIGWLAQSSISVDYKSVTDMTVKQDVFERFLINSGTLNIDTAGGPGEEIMLHHVAKPYQLRDSIFSYTEKKPQPETITPIPAVTNSNQPPTPPTL